MDNYNINHNAGIHVEFRSNVHHNNNQVEEQLDRNVRVAQGLFTRRRGRLGPRPSRVNAALRQVDLDVESIAHFKERPFHEPNNEISRPMQHACKNCILGTYAQNIVHPYFRTLGVKNMFTVKFMNKSYPFYIHAMAHLYHYYALPEKSTEVALVDPTKVNYDLLQDQVTETEGTPVNKSLVQKLIKLIAIFPPRRHILDIYLRVIGWICSKLFGCMFDGVLISNGEVELLDAAQKSGLPIVFVPVCRSKWDPILISWTLFNCGLKPALFITPHIMAGTRWLKKFFKLFGGICYSGSPKGRNMIFDQPELSQAFAIYFSSLLKKGSSIMLFVEPHRSRSGVISTCLIGSEVFSIVEKMHTSRLLEDVCFVPVSVNYDILPDQELVSDYSIVDQTKKWYWGWRSWLRLFSNKKGLVRVSISQPYRLREFNCSNENGSPIINDLKIDITDEPCFSIEGGECQWFEENGSVVSTSSLYGEVNFLNKWNPIHENLLFHHLAYDAECSSVFMSTQLVSFLLVHKFPEGVNLNTLTKEFDEVVKTIRHRFKRDVGFTGTTSDVIRRSIDLLGTNLVTVNKSRKINETTFCPKKSKKSRVNLSYYANPIVGLFIKDGIVATTLFTLTNMGQRTGVPPLNEQESQEYQIREMDLVRESLQICEFMKGEFYLHPPCTTTYSFINDHNEKMELLGFIQFIRRRVNVERDDDDDYYAPPLQMSSLDNVEFILEQDKLDFMKFCSALVTPYLQIYGIITNGLKVLVNKGAEGMEEKELRSCLYDECESYSNGPLIFRKELITENTIRNYLLTLYRIGILDYYASSSSNYMKMIYITGKYRSEQYLEYLGGYLLTFCGQAIYM